MANPLHARVYWPFQGAASFADPICYLCFMLVFLWLVAYWDGLASCVWCFLAFLLLSHVVSRPVWCLVVSIPDLCLLLYFE